MSPPTAAAADGENPADVTPACTSHWRPAARPQELTEEAWLERGWSQGGGGAQVCA